MHFSHKYTVYSHIHYYKCIHTHASIYTHLTCVCLRELTRRSKWCPISYLSAPRVYLPGYIIICCPSHMIWGREVQNPRHPREPSQDVMRDTGLWPNTLSHTYISTSTCTIWPPPFSFKFQFFSPSSLNLPHHSFDFCHPLLSFFLVNLDSFFTLLDSFSC